MTYNHIDVVPIAGALGAEIHGVDLSQPLDAPIIQEINEAWLEYLVLFFREQKLETAEFKTFGRYFGELQNLPYLSKLGDDEELQVLKFGTIPGAPPTNILHIDSSSRQSPSKAAILYAVDVPEAGGDTIWVNAYAAYDTLSPAMQKLVSRVTAFFPNLDVSMRDRLVTQGLDSVAHVAASGAKEPTVYPLVHKHPETGKKALFIDPLRLWRIKEMHQDESMALINFLNDHITKPELQCRFHWRPGSLAMWDNRCTLHRVVDDPFDGPRTLYRVSLEGSPWPLQ